MSLSLILKAVPYVLIALLIGGILYMRADLIKVGADRDKAQAAVAELAAVNDANAKVIEADKAAALLNSQTVIDLTAQLADLRARSIKSQSDIQRIIGHDAKSKTWADLPVPDELRGAIN
jgi:uncharacterized membrane protein